MGVTIEACELLEMEVLSEFVLLIVAPSESMMLPIAKACLSMFTLL